MNRLQLSKTSLRPFLALAVAAVLSPAWQSPTFADGPATRPAAGSTTAPATKRPADLSSDEVIRRYVAHAQASPRYSADQKKLIAQMATQTIDDPSEARDRLTMILIRVTPDLQSAVTAIADDRAEEARGLLRGLIVSPDPYLRAHALYFMVRDYSSEGRFEEALPLAAELDAVAGSHTLYPDEAAFLLGMCQASILRRDEAARTLQGFLDRYPDAPQRMVVGARQTVARIKAIKDDTVGDVQDRMGFSQRRLAAAQTNKSTQGEQKKIIDILEKLIKEAEEKEKGGGGGSGSGQGQGQGSGPPSGSGNPTNPAQSSSAPDGASDGIGSLHGVQRGDERNWANLSERKRQEVLDALKAQFPDRYRALVEQYYKSLQQEPGR